MLRARSLFLAAMRTRLRSRARALGVVMTLAGALAATPSANAAVPAHGRAWELVTNAPTNGANLIDVRAVSADGDRVAYSSFGPMPGAPSGDLVSGEAASRTASGWVQQLIGEPFSVPLPDLLTSGPLAVDDAMSTWLWSSDQPLLPGAPPPGQAGVYLRGPDGGLRLLGAAGDARSFAFAAADDAMRHAVFQTTAHLLAADAGRIAATDAYELAGGDLRLVGADDAGHAISPCGSQVGTGVPSTSRLVHAVSRDGTRIFFGAPADSGCGQPRGIYLREDGTHTIAVSASACTRVDCSPPQDVAFAGATPDGSRAFLLTAQQLTNDDTDAGIDLYRYDVADGTLTRLSAGPPGVTADVSSPIVRSSDDGERVYFVADGQLVPGQGQPGSPSVYLWDHGQLRFVAPLGLDLSSAALTPDGRVLAFATSAALVAGDTDSAVDIYRYDADGGTLQLVSHGAGGAGDGAFDVSVGGSGLTNPLRPDDPRWMSADGARIFFVTSEALVPEDVDGTPDVYEWFDGDVGLVSSGTGDATLAYGGASADGRSVFFKTDQTLVPADTNGGDDDLYVARLGGGFPAPPPPVPACEGDACQGPHGSLLARPQPGTLTYVEPPAHALRIRALDRRARSALASAGGAVLVVDVPAAGTVSLFASARLRGRTRVVAHASAHALGSGSLRLRVRLTAAARRSLRAHGRLRLTLVLRDRPLRAAASLTTTLGSGR